MNIQAIRTTCKRRGICTLITHAATGQQWISDGAGAYLVEGIEISKAALPALCNFDANELDKILLSEALMDDDRFTLEPIPNEQDCEDLGMVYALGQLFRALRTPNGILFIEAAELRPAEGKEGIDRFAVRENENGKLLAAYSGLLAKALIAPTSPGMHSHIMDALDSLLRIGADRTWINRA